MSDVRYYSEVRRNRIIFALVGLAIAGVYGFLIGPANLLKVGVLLLVSITLLAGGSVVIISKLGRRERLAFVALATWYGICFAVFSLLGMLFNPRAQDYPWSYTLAVAGGIGLVTFIGVLLGTPVNMAALRLWRRAFGNPMSRSK